MTSFELERVAFTEEAVSTWAPLSPRNTNWPVVYVLDDASEDTVQRSRRGEIGDVYVGESLNVVARMRQHFDSPDKRHLRTIRVIIDETFNKSACLDLESSLIRWLSGDGNYRVLNRNDGITEAEPSRFSCRRFVGGVTG